ncbi:MAG: hypothetical protein OXC40_00165 [Proteobacteria bacterium]|nr:hypothetical protein [Pseudomonadota bacterium]
MKISPKQLVRQQASRYLKAQSQGQRDQASRRMSNLLNTYLTRLQKKVGSAQYILLASYWPLPWEYTMRITTQVQGLYLPRVMSDTEMIFFLYDGDSSQLSVDYAGILAPKELEQTLTQATTKDSVTVFVVPCLAINQEGARLGYGKGYYDRFFCEYQSWLDKQKALNQMGDFITLAVTASQFVSVESLSANRLTFSADVWDLKMDCVLTSNKLMFFREDHPLNVPVMG